MTETAEIPTAILDQFHLLGGEEGEIQVSCPFHTDGHPSASLNMDKQVYFCHSCHRGLNFKQLEVDLEELHTNTAFTHTAVASPEPAVYVGAFENPSSYLARRGFPAGTPLGIHTYTDNGYLMFGENGVQGRNLADDDRPKYLSEKGEKGLLWFGPAPGKSDSVWLVEGVFDAMSLHQILPSQPIACSFGSHLSEQQAYELVGRTVFIAYDCDFAGWKGARQARKQLLEFDANGIIIDFPEALGNDMNDAYVADKEAFERWLYSVLGEYSTKDDAYVAGVFRGFGDHSLLTVSTGIGQYDDMLNGGYRPGVHIMAAESGIGKSSWAIAFAVRAARGGHRVLYVTNEIPKRQVWARMAASMSSGSTWSEIEADPRTLDEPTLQKVDNLANSVRVVAGWSVGQIKYVAHNYDVIIVDYLQRMGGPFKGEAVKANIDHNITELSNLGRDNGKVIVAISSLNRVGYGDMTKAALKESGNIEYVSQSITGLKRAQGSDRVMGIVLKNTRGAEEVFWMQLDLAGQKYKESVPVPVGPVKAKTKAKPNGKSEVNLGALKNVN